MALRPGSGQAPRPGSGQVRAPADKRFRRAHVSPARRRRFWPNDWRTTARTTVLMAIGLYAGYRAVQLVLSAEALTIERITVTGNARLSKGEVVALLDGIRGQHMLATSLEPWRLKLKESPWVADAALRRVLPGRIDVAILERVPIGIGRIGDDLYLVDREGTIIDAYGPNYADLDLPVISGLAAAPRDGGSLVDADRAALAARLLEGLVRRRDLAARISEIDVTDVRDAVVMLEDDTTVLRVGDEQFLKRLESYVELAPALRERVPDMDYVDLRFDDRVYVRPVALRGSAVREPGSAGRTPRRERAVQPRGSDSGPAAATPGLRVPSSGSRIPDPGSPKGRD
jgi:cell division protein FtsQ